MVNDGHPFCVQKVGENWNSSLVSFFYLKSNAFSENSFCPLTYRCQLVGAWLGLRRRRGAQDLQANLGENPDGKSLLKEALTSVCGGVIFPSQSTSRGSPWEGPAQHHCMWALMQWAATGTADPTPGHCNGSTQVMTTPTYWLLLM